MSIWIRRRWFCLPTLALICCVLFLGCDRGWPGKSRHGRRGSQNEGVAEAAGPKKPKARKFKIPVTVRRLIRGPMNAYLQAVGTIRPLKEVEIKAEMSGRIYFAKRWKDGDHVEEGTPLARIDDTTLQLDLREAERALELAQQSLIPAKATMERRSKEEEFSKQMFERGAYSEVQYEAARLSRIQSESAYKQALTTIETKRTQIEKIKKDKYPPVGVMTGRREFVVNTVIEQLAAVGIKWEKAKKLAEAEAAPVRQAGKRIDRARVGRP